MTESPARNWKIVNEFGGSKCYVDLNSVNKRGEVTKAVFKYALIPPGTDKRNGKKVAAMLTVEEYNLQVGLVRMQQMAFQYEDGTASELMQADDDWKTATGGNQATLKFIRELP